MNVMSKLLVFLLFLLSSAAHAIVIDGDLNDWIGSPKGKKLDWKPIDPTVNYFVEDRSGRQAYDAEAIYVTQDALNFYVAVVTGLAPGSTKYPAGDLAFDFGNDGIYEYGVVVKSDSRTPNGGKGKKGDVFEVKKWNVGLWDDNGNNVGIGNGTNAHPTTVKSGKKLPGLAQIVYKKARYNGKSLTNKLGKYKGTHYLIEASISKDFFDTNDLTKPFTVHWTMASAHDSISVDPLPLNVPTPAVLPMLALGLTLLTGFRRNPNQTASKIGF